MLVADAIVGFIAPYVCLGCGSEGSVLCGECIDNFVDVVQPRCAGCKKLSDDFRVCKTCRSWLPLQSVFVATNYDTVSEKIVHALKFEAKRRAVEPMAEIMTAHLKNAFSGRPLLCPVPTAPSRVRERGFDHALMLAELLHKKNNLQVVKAVRREGNARQVGASRSTRFSQMESAFSFSNSQLDGAHVIIVDDVFTTGATLSAVAKLLKNAGAGRVSAVVFAQKV